MSVATKRNARRFCQLLIAAVLFAAFAAPPAAAASGRPAAADRIATADITNTQDLFAIAQAQGHVRVIVGLALPQQFQAEGELAAADAVSQRQAIADAAAALTASLDSASAHVYATYQSLPYVAVKADVAGLQQLVDSPLVTSLTEDTADPPTLASSTALIGLPAVWASGVDGAGQAVVILDTGLDTDHPFFGNRVIDGACFSNMVGSGGRVSLCPNGAGSQTGVAAAESDVANPGCWLNGSPLCWHGTHVAGIAAGGDDNTFDGVARAANIIPIQVFTRFENYPSCGGSGTCILSNASDQLSAMDYVFTTLRNQHTIASVNLSLGGGSYTSNCDFDPRKTGIDNLRSVGIATVVAAGNNNWTNALTAPACITTAVSVGGVNDTDTPPADAIVYNMHDLVDLLSPARSVTSSYVGGGYATASGTSMATPHVTGAFALCKSVNPALSVDQIEAILEQTGVSISDTRPGGLHTKPRIQLDAAIAACQSANVWTGAVNDQWNNPANWSEAVVPADANFVGIPAAASGQPRPRISGGTAAARSLVIEAGGQLDMSGGTLYVAGSVETLGNGLLNATGGSVVVRGEGPHVIALSPASRFFNLQIGEGAAMPPMVAATDLAIAGNLTLRPGATLDLATHTATVDGTVENLGTLQQTKDAPAALTSFLYLTNAGGAVGKYWGVEITPVASMGATTVSIQGNTSCSAGASRVNRCYEISPTSPQTAQVKFYFKTSEAGQSDEPVSWHWNGTTWEQLPFAGRGGSGDAMYVLSPEVSAYSAFELGDSGPLAVTLAGFSAVSQPTQVQVTWETVSEIDNAGFVLWRSNSPDAAPQQLGFVPSQGPGSAQGFVYSYQDASAQAGQTYWYWLDAVELNGAVQRHGPVSVTHNAPFTRR